MNVSAVLDMKEIESISPDAILYVWQGGEIGGLGTADVLMGRKKVMRRTAGSAPRALQSGCARRRA